MGDDDRIVERVVIGEKYHRIGRGDLLLAQVH